MDALGAQRIGHGCSAAGDPELMRRLARDGIVVECCLSSNYHTGAVKRGRAAPHPALPGGGRARGLCCDNTTVSRTDQVRESLQAAEQIGLDAVEQIHRAAAAYTFIRPELALKDADHDL